LAEELKALHVALTTEPPPQVEPPQEDPAAATKSFRALKLSRKRPPATGVAAPISSAVRKSLGRLSLGKTKYEEHFGGE